MLACLAAAVVCVTCGILGFGSLFTLTVNAQSLAFLVMALSALVFFGAFDAYEERRAAGTDSPEEG
jgi:hypothetical protein